MMIRASENNAYTMGNRFSLPNEVFQLGLSSGALAVYSFLLRCEDRKTYQCWPSYRTIARATNQCVTTVRKHVGELLEKQLIQTEPTSVVTKKGVKRNGTLLYTILPISRALEYNYQQQMRKLEMETEKARRRENEKPLPGSNRSPAERVRLEEDTRPQAVCAGRTTDATRRLLVRR